jgi:tetratricopeptide (TPR) repeat protein
VPKLSESQELKININGMALEKAGRIDEAIALYESGVAKETSTPGTYERLIALYWKAKRYDDERRICELAAKRWPTARDGHGNVSPSTFSSRLARIQARSTRARETSG